MEEWLKYTGSLQFHRVVVPTQPIPEQVYNDVSDGLETTVHMIESTPVLENLVQAILNCFDEKPDFVIGGFNQSCHKFLTVIIQILAANGVKRIFVGPKGIITRPAISYLAHKNRMYGLLLHNSCIFPKSNIAVQLIDIKGGPASPKDRITLYGHCQSLKEYYSSKTIDYDFNRTGYYMIKVDESETSISILPFQSTVDSYIKLLKDFFDFGKINDLLSGLSFNRPFRICIDCRNGAVGPFAKALFEEELGANGSIINYEPIGGNKPLDFTRLEEQTFQTTMAMSTHDFGAVVESDGGRCIVYGRRGFHVPPGDSLAIIADSYHCIPYFQLYKFNGVGRTFYTSRAVDEIMARQQLSVIECPASCYFFNELLYKNAVLFCGDDSGMISKHVKDRDALWTILAWLSVIAHKSKPLTNIVHDFWEAKGRNFRTVHEFFDLTSDNVAYLMDGLQTKIEDPEFVDTVIQANPYKFTVEKAGAFNYSSSGMGDTMKNLGLYINLKPSARVVYRVVFTGVSYIFQIIVDMTLQSEQLPHYANRFAVTEPLAKTAVKLAHTFKFLKKMLPDRVY